MCNGNIACLDVFSDVLLNLYLNDIIVCISVTIVTSMDKFKNVKSRNPRRSLLDSSLTFS